MNDPLTTPRTRLVIVDDDDDLLSLMKARLTRIGYTVDTAPCGKHLLDYIKETPPSLILIDIQMGSVQGDVICRLLKTSESTSSIPVVMFSGNEDIEDVSQSCEANGFIRKPFNPEIFEREIERYVR